MSKMNYELYIDESGDFSSDDLNRNRIASFVGGVLCPSKAVSGQTIDRMIDGPIHAMESYDKERFFSIIESLLQKGCRIVLFENNDRIRVQDGDTTYLNIITEGLTKLLRDLHNEDPEALIDISILIATRQNSEEREKGNTIRIAENEYLRRFEEKMLVSLGRNKIDHVTFTISFANAQKDKRLMLADIICNTWISRKAKVKFTAEDRAKIADLYKDSIRYEVYEDPDAGYLRRLISENRIGEAIAQLCAHPRLKKNLVDIQSYLLERIAKEYPKDRELYFSYISLKLGQFNRGRYFKAGIEFAENYKEYILMPLTEKKETREAAEFWIFDTDFYLVTMFDHIGDADQCAEAANRCNARIKAVSRSWEHIDYYFKFRIRELNQMMGRFEFERILELSTHLIDVLQTAKELFSMIGTDVGETATVRSDLLGKVYGVRLEAYINLLHDHPEYFDEALQTSDFALAEFTRDYDIRRQYEYRCLLFVTARKPDEALDSLLQAFGFEYSQDVFAKMIDGIFVMGRKTDVFSLMHYTNVMLLMREKDDPRAKAMKDALMNCARFVNEAENSPEDDDYPWNMILWNVGRYWRLEGNYKAANERISRALAITERHKSEKTMYSFAVCIAADQLNWELRTNGKNADGYLKQFNTHFTRMTKMDLADTMRDWLSRDITDLVPLK